LMTQRGDGAWPGCSYYTGPMAPAPRSVWFGGEAATTALCLEALSHFASVHAIPIEDPRASGTRRTPTS
jgi:hypothetical protein